MGTLGARRRGAFAAWGLAVVLVGWAAAGAWASDMPKAEALKHTLADMTAARRALAERGAAAAELGDRLRAHLAALRSEIDRERRENAPGSLQQALRVERIGYNLRLAQRLSNYLEQVERRIDSLRAAGHTLEYTARRAQDELLMVKVLADAEISGLLAQAESALNEAALQTRSPLLNAAEPPSRTLESFWNELSRAP
ncbi:MAG: hypothetical protein R6V84_01500 [Desulfobacterales bacterium]